MSDVFISGAGLAGMILAARLAQKGLSVTICDPSTPPREAAAEGSDLRSTAYLELSRRVLAEAGLWDALAPHSMPLDALQVIDTSGWPPVERARRTFRPADMELDSFGWNVSNWRARSVLADHLEGHPGVTLRLGTGFREMFTRDDMVRVTLDDGTTIRTRLVVGADGHASPVRRAAGIDVRTWRYGQKAFAFAARHDAPHDNVSTEIYNSGGALVTVPLPDHEGQPTSAIVWMNDGRSARRLAALDADGFAAELDTRTLRVLGHMRPVTAIRAWPVVTQIAERLSARRVVLVAEAAHVLPPIGAQGLNTSIADIAALADAIDPADPGAAAPLERYARARERDMRLRSGTIDLFNRICRSGNPLVQGLRRTGLGALHDIAPLRLKVMQAGMGGDPALR
ncbi:FAD-dependent monooxygenase [Palleronia sp. LCG004]|uniref:FAD-dependent monooxygenase n=1 Tax=Palleronia sp. LCG004 TaxID=3079304 RepID=UPI002943A847|nr:FAD-dependent monooxygenase [Palleronia sp. LCG004]WOI57515.1 FAD-dependent monooxygenase [Palleronia sp. LCG004]